jgi:hypothetical protein
VKAREVAMKTMMVAALVVAASLGAARAEDEGRLPASIVDALIAALDDEDPEVRHQVARVLGRLDHPRATEALMKALKSPDVEMRRAAARGLGRSGGWNGPNPNPNPNPNPQPKPQPRPRPQPRQL